MAQPVVEAAVDVQTSIDLKNVRFQQLPLRIGLKRLRLGGLALRGVEAQPLGRLGFPKVGDDAVLNDEVQLDEVVVGPA